MDKNKLVELLSKCTSQERPLLKKFVQSPYLNKNNSIQNLIIYLIDNFDSMPNDKKILYQIAYPQDTFQEKRFRYLISNSAKLVTRFWLIQSYESDKTRLLTDQMSIFSKRGLAKGYQQSLRNWENQQAKNSNTRDVNYWEMLYHSEVKEEHFERKRARIFDTNIDELAIRYDRYYYLNRLRKACEMLNRETILQGKYKHSLTPNWFVYLKEQDFFGDPLIVLYYMMWKILKEPENEKHFDSFLQRIYDPKLKIDSITLGNFYLAAVNYSLRKLREGNFRYRKKALDLYLETIDKRLLLENGELSPWTFSNIVKLALNEKKQEWLEKFIKEKVEMLPLSFQENALNYNLAEVYYNNKQYELAQEYLSKVTFSDLNYYLGARILLAKIYYTAGEIEALLSLVSAFTIFLKRNKKVSTNIKQTCLNFCEILFQLAKNNDKKKVSLEHKIQTTELLAERHWLLALLN